MRIVFMGSPEYAAIILEALADNHEVVGVYTNADKVRSRGSNLSSTPVKRVALERDIPVFTPASLRNADVQDEIRGLRPDAICVAACGKILPPEVLSIPRLGCLNVHASLLPRWRGAAPIQRAILAGDEVQGISIMRMEAGLDTGDFALQVQCDARGKSVAELTEELAHFGAEALLRVLVDVEDGAAVWQAQDEASVTYADKIAKHELDLLPEDSVRTACLKVLAADDTHPAKCTIAGRDVALLSCGASDVSVPSGEARMLQGRLTLGFADGALTVDRVKPDGKAAMEGKAFAAGLQGIKGGLSWSALGEAL